MVQGSDTIKEEFNTGFMPGEINMNWFKSEIAQRKVRIRDRIAVFLVKIIVKMGYTFYIRNMVDHPDVNGSDIAIFTDERADVPIEYRSRFLVVSQFGVRYKELLKYNHTLVYKRSGRR